jgi:hypothetical protein
MSLLPTIAAVLLAGYAAEASSTKAATYATLAILGVLLVVVVAVSRRDAVSLLTVMLVALFVIPENFVISGPLRSVGNPALLSGLVCLVVWLSARWMGVIRAEPMHPYRWTMLFFFVTCLTGYAAAMSRVLTTAENDSATRTIFPVVAMIGIALLATDGLGTVENIERLLKRLIVLVSIQGLFGAMEFFAKLNYHELARLPGLVLNTELNDQTRSGYARIEAAAAHPIEFSVALAAVVPLALHFAVSSKTVKARRWFWISAGVMVAVIPLTLSRSGVLALVVGVALYGAVLKGRARANLLTLGGLGLVAFPVIAPGILGTVRSFFFAGTKDNSITGRLDDYARIPGLMDGHWWFGRGFGTFQPLVYFFLDNQYLMSLLTCGVLGLCAVVGVFVVGSGVARGARKRFVDENRRNLGQAITASIMCLAVTAATFDMFSFYQCCFLLFLLGGCGATLWTVARAEERHREALAQRFPEPQEVEGRV